MFEVQFEMEWSLTELSFFSVSSLIKSGGVVTFFGVLGFGGAGFALKTDIKTRQILKYYLTGYHTIVFKLLQSVKTKH